MMINNLMNWTKVAVPTLNNENGQDLAEYALVLVFVAVEAVAGITALGGTVSDIFAQITSGLITSVPVAVFALKYTRYIMVDETLR